MAGETHEVTAEELSHLIQEKPGIILDVRTGPEYYVRHIPGAIHLNVLYPSYLKRKAKQFPPDKPVYLYCFSGHRSLLALKILKKTIPNDIYHLTKGFKEYRKNKSLPIEGKIIHDLYSP